MSHLKRVPWAGATHLPPVRRRWSAGRISYLPAWRATEALGWARARVSESSAIHRSGGDRRHPRVLRTDAAVTAVRTGSDGRPRHRPWRPRRGTEPDHGRDHPDADPDADPTRSRASAGGRPLVGDERPVPRRTRRGVDRNEHTYRRVLVTGSLSGATPSTPDQIRAAVNADARTSVCSRPASAPRCACPRGRWRRPVRE